MPNETIITSHIIFVSMFTQWLNDNTDRLSTQSSVESVSAIKKEWSRLTWTYLHNMITKPEILNSKEQSFSYPESEE